MAYQFTVDDARFLSGDAGAEALASADSLALTDGTMLRDMTRLRRQLGERAAVVAETVRLRRRALAKIGPVAQNWLFTDQSLQQATPAPVAAHRARRLAEVGVHDLTCSIGADLVALCAGRGPSSPVVGSDLDPVRVLMARHNLAASGWPAPVFIGDALTRTSRGLLAYADPARRDGTGRRITSVSTLPSVADLDAVHAARPPVLRLPPGIDYDSLQRPGEVEIVSLDGGAREAVLWPVELATVQRRATVLVTADPARSWQLTSDEPEAAEVRPVQVGDVLVDPDAAVVRAHLVRHYAARHGLSLVDPHLAYLAGPAAPPGVRGFRVLDIAPYREKTVGGWARRDGTGTLEIKQRGTPVIPDELRRRLRPALTGPTTATATLVVARIGNTAQAMWCRAEGPPADHRAGDSPR